MPIRKNKMNFDQMRSATSYCGWVVGQTTRRKLVLPQIISGFFAYIIEPEIE